MKSAEQIIDLSITRSRTARGGDLIDSTIEKKGSFKVRLKAVKNSPLVAVSDHASLSRCREDSLRTNHPTQPPDGAVNCRIVGEWPVMAFL